MAFGQPVSYDAFEQLLTGDFDASATIDSLDGLPTTKSFGAGMTVIDSDDIHRSVLVDLVGSAAGTGDVEMRATVDAGFLVETSFSSMPTKESFANILTSAPQPEPSPEPVLVWSAADLATDLPTPAMLPSSPFFLPTNYRVVVTDHREALTLVVNALLAAGCDLCTDQTPATGKAALVCTLSSGEGRCDFEVMEYFLPVSEGSPAAYVFELCRTAGDKYAFNSLFMSFASNFDKLADASGVVAAGSIHSPGVPIMYHPAAIGAATPLPVHLAAFAGDAVVQADASDFSAVSASVSASSPDTSLTAASVPVSAPPVASSSPSTASATASAEDHEAARREYEALVVLLNAEQDDVREEGAARILHLIKTPTACRATLREKGAMSGLINALVRAQSGMGCHSLVAQALAEISTCPACAKELVDHGAVFALTAMVVSPCELKSIRLRRAAAQGLANLAVVPEAAAQANGSGAVAFLRYAASSCQDSVFRTAAATAADALNPDASITPSDAASTDFPAIARRARTTAVTMATASRTSSETDAASSI